MLIKSERIAERILTDLGWCPERMTVNSIAKINVGMPDFKCSNNRYVEVKKATQFGNRFSIELAQLQVFGELLNKGKKVYIMVIHNDLKDYSLIQIENLKFKIKILR
jgi:hypothetical protein